MKDIRFTQGVVVNIASVSSTAVRVDLDGCPSTDSSVNCRGNDSIIVYRGGEETARDHSLQPFKGTERKSLLISGVYKILNSILSVEMFNVTWNIF